MWRNNIRIVLAGRSYLAKHVVAKYGGKAGVAKWREVRDLRPCVACVRISQVF